MKLLLLGATGRCGNLVLFKALKDGHEVTVIARDPSKLEETTATVIKGSPYDKDTVEKAIASCDAVICTLNVSRVSDNPWAKLRAPHDLISKSVNNAVKAMHKHNIKRIISLSVLGVGDSKKGIPFLARLFVYKSNIKYAMWDHERQENIMAQSETDWTAVRLPMLNDTKGEAKVLVNMGDDTKLNKSINRESVARFVLDILDHPNYYKKIVAISNA